MPVCFVIMGFGQKTDLATGRVLDLDKSYRNMIKPAVEAAGYDCVRADEIQHSGVIDVPMYEMLFSADLVVADLSTANLNAVFELGVRHALKPRATIIIAESKFTIPFDANHIVVRHDEHLGPDIGFDEVMRMRTELTTLAGALKGRGGCRQSRLYGASRSPEANPPPRDEDGPGCTPRGSTAIHPRTVTPPCSARPRRRWTPGCSTLAKKKLQDIYKEQTAPGADGKPKSARPFIVQQLALATYKAGEAKAKTDGPEQALVGYAQAEALLRQLDIDNATDPETLGLWSAIHKRRAEFATRSPEEQIGTSTRRFARASAASSSNGTITTERTSHIS